MFSYRSPPSSMIKGYAPIFAAENSHLLPPAQVIAASSVGKDYRWCRFVTMRFVVNVYPVYWCFGQSRPPLDLCLG